ncbi:hypothetical protein [Nocardia violaceofusca]|uniref:hypothetical protein n=1 Tax=Nocardia violaceofusca TaxID=941182 RepID=UPI0007A4AD56|nr:hypothetical protein [Nocardia violaceofusca]
MNAARSQSGADSMQRNLGHGSIDPTYITDLEHWEGVPHQVIYDGAQAMTPGIMHSQAKTWTDIGASLGGGLFGLNLAIQRALSDGFHGQVAAAASDAANKFIQQGTAVQEVIEAVGARIHATAYGAEAVKLTVPKPGSKATPTATPATDLAGLALPGVQAAGAAVSDGNNDEELYRQAVMAMNLNYNPTYRPAGENVPTFVPVDSPGDGGTNNPNSGGPYSSNGPSTPGKTTSPGDQQKPGDQDKQPSSDQSQQTDPASTSQGQGNQPGNQNSNPGSSLPGGNTTPAGVDSTSAAGFGGPGSGVGSSGGLGGTSGGAPGGPGRSVPGMPGGGTPSAAASFGARSGQAGASGMPGMGGLGGARKNEDSEKEHKTPDYLVMDREEELFGRQDPALGGAIGADIPAAQFRPEDRERRR